MTTTQAPHPAPPYRAPRPDLREYDTTYLEECLAAWRALSGDCAQAAEIEEELRRRATGQVQ